MSGIGLSLNSRIQLFYIIYCYCWYYWLYFR